MKWRSENVEEKNSNQTLPAQIEDRALLNSPIEMEEGLRSLLRLIKMEKENEKEDPGGG